MTETEVDKKVISPEETTPNQIEGKDVKVLPWDKVEHEIPIKSFGGYEIKLNGYIRHDIREKRLQDQLKQQELLAQNSKEDKEQVQEQVTQTANVTPTTVKIESSVEPREATEKVSKEQVQEQEKEQEKEQEQNQEKIDDN